MKTKLITTVLVMGVALQASAMGHPHNVFAARKQMKAKRAAISHAPCSDSSRSQMTGYVKSTVAATTTVWNWLNQNGAK